MTEYEIVGYAKYVDENTIQRPRKNIKTPHLVAFNFDKNESLLKQEGYYPLVETNKPEDVEDETHIAKPTYALKEAHHTETVEKPTVLVNEDGTEEQTTVNEEIVVDDSVIEVTYIAVDRPEESENGE